MNPAAAIDARAALLRSEAARRWLVKDELVFLLLHYKLVGVPVLHTLQTRPPSGTLLFYSTLEVPDYKKDGWRWQKRKDQSGRVREDRAKLVINREVIVLGTYVHSADAATFHRRIYSVRDSQEHVVLVHYFDETNKESVTASQPSHGKPSSNGASKGMKRSLAFAKPHNPSTSFMPSYPLPGPLKTVPPEETVDAIMTNCFELDFEPNANPYHDPMADVSEMDLLLLKDNPMDGITTDFDDDELFKDLTPTSISTSEASRQAFELAEISDFSPDWDFGDGGAKILICLASRLPEELAQDPVKLFVQFGGRRVRAEKVSDTVLRCTAPSSRALGGVELFVCHCSGPLLQENIQLSHKKPFTYRSHYQVSPSLAGEIATESHVAHGPAPTALELAAPSSLQGGHGIGKRGRSPTVFSRVDGVGKLPERRRIESNRTLSSYVESDLDERQCKIRVVERLSEFHQAIRTKAAEPALNPASPLAADRGRDLGITAEFPTDNMPSLPTAEFSSSSWTDQVQQHGDLGQDCQSEGATESASTLLSSSGTSIALDDCTIETLSDKDLEQLSEKLLERVVRQLITVAHTSEELLEELNSLDETGLSLLHYVSFYNYAQLVPVLVAHGAHINQQSTQGQTALHLAAGCGHDEVVAVLLQSGADLLVLDFDGLTAADRAEKSGHAEVSGTLRRHMGVEVSASVSSAVDETAGFGGSPMEIDDVPTPYRDAGDMGLLEGDEHADIVMGPTHSHSSSCESSCEASYASKSTSYQAGENQEHNRKLLLGAFSTMSLHDKCALSLSISRDSVGHNARRRESSAGEEGMGSPGGSSSTTSVGLGSSPASMVGLDGTLVATRLLLAGGEHDSDVKSVIAEDEESLTKLQAAMELMGPEERQSLEDEVTVLQHNIRAWLLKRNCKNMRETTKKLREATQSIEDQQKQQEAGERHAMLANEISQRERAAVTVQAATRTMLARRSFLQTKHVAIKVQAATRGVLCRKNFARMKAHALASLVIQRNVREWWHKQPAATRPTEDDEGDEEDEEKAEAPMVMEGALREPHEDEGLHTMHSM